MEHIDSCSDPLDQLVSETLQEHLGPPPTPIVWERIAREVSRAPRRPWTGLLSLFVGPMLQSALVVAVLAFLIVQPAYYWMQSEGIHSVSIAPRTLPLNPHERNFEPDPKTQEWQRYQSLAAPGKNFAPVGSDARVAITRRPVPPMQGETRDAAQRDRNGSLTSVGTRATQAIRTLPQATSMAVIVAR